jgi:molybdopterin/thiamine biosynthesis adenylyltransferase
MTNERFDRNIRFFGEEGQDRLAASHVVIVGIGGLGSHVVQQLALLGIGRLTLIDKEELDITNLNRYVGVRQNDPLPGTLKVNLGYRLLKEINSGIDVYPMPISFMSEKAMDAIIKSDYVFGCLDCEGARLVLTELCSAYSIPYFDLASDIVPGHTINYGGRVCVAWDGHGCIVCYDQIDIAEAQSDLLSLDVRRNRDAIYGIERDALGVMGPSVVSINGVVASMAVTEFMLGVTGIRLPKRLLTYLGHMGIVTSTKEEPAPDCYYCKGIRGKRDKADIKRYIRAGITL